MASGDSSTASANHGQFSGIKQEKIIIQNKWGEKLVGLLHETGSKQIVTVSHGVLSTKEYSMMMDFCIALEKQGITAFRFDFSGNGESEGSSQRADFLKEVDDLKAVIQHFSAANRVVSAIIGHSKGGSVVVLYASLHKDIKTVVNVSGRYKLDGPIEERFGNDYLEKFKKGELLLGGMEETVMQLLNINMHEAGLRVDQDCKVLIVHGSADEITPVEDALEFAKIIPNNELRIIEGANHDYTNHRGIEQQKIIIQNKRGEKLVGLLHETGSKEIVILCHGFRDSKNYSMMVDLALALKKQGISSFRFDFSGNGESEGLFQFANYHNEVNDLKAVIQHFTAVNRLITAILGHSKGGTVVLLYASLYHDIHTVVNVSSRYNMDSGLEDRLGKNYMERAKRDGFIDIKSRKGKVLYRVTEESLMEWMNINMHETCLKVDQNCRVLTVHGSVDEVIPVEDALEFAKIIPNHELRIIEGANHGYSNRRDELASVVLAFIKANMHRV